MSDQAGEIQFACPRCKAPLVIGEEQAGKVLRCPQCEHVVKVPGPTVVAGRGALDAEILSELRKQTSLLRCLVLAFVVIPAIIWTVMQLLKGCQ